MRRVKREMLGPAQRGSPVPVAPARASFFRRVSSSGTRASSNDTRASKGTPASKDKRRGWWFREARRWHWISAAISLTGLVLFSVTGITLNHASRIDARPSIVSRELSLTPALRASIEAAAQAEQPGGKAPLPRELRDWLSGELALRLPERAAEWSEDEIYLDLPRPGGDAWLRIDIEDGSVEYESTSRGWVSYLNDLHKGRHTGAAWAWYIDLLAVACLVFAVTGLILLQQHVPKRPSTWPLVGFSLLLPLVLALLFIH